MVGRRTARAQRNTETAFSIHSAAARGDIRQVERIVKSRGRRALDEPDLNGQTPLLIAVENGRLHVIAKLIELGANVNACSPKNMGTTALREAAAIGSLEMVKLLVAAGADPLVPGRFNLTALDRARERRTPEGRMITVFLERHVASHPVAAKRRK